MSGINVICLTENVLFGLLPTVMLCCCLCLLDLSVLPSRLGVDSKHVSSYSRSSADIQPSEEQPKSRHSRELGSSAVNESVFHASGILKKQPFKIKSKRIHLYAQQATMVLKQKERKNLRSFHPVITIFILQTERSFLPA